MSTATMPFTTKSFDFICSMVRDRSAIVIEPGKSYLIESRLSPIVRDENLSSIDELVEELKRPGQNQLMQKVIEAMTTNESSFFRDIHPFQALKTEILPKLIASRASERCIHIWSNACSSGQEIYSIAMMIEESFPQLADWKIKLLGTDLSTQILDRAKQGIFNQTEVNRGLPMPMLLKYFTRDGIHWRIKETIRQKVEFKKLNLVDPFPSNFPKMDIVFLRNVLIYFAPETKRTILLKTHASLQSDGYLFLGGAETTMNLSVPYIREQAGQAVWYRPSH